MNHDCGRKDTREPEPNPRGLTDQILVFARSDYGRGHRAGFQLGAYLVGAIWLIAYAVGRWL